MPQPDALTYDYQPGDILLMRHQGGMYRRAAQATGGPFSHAALVFASSMYGTYTLEATRNGVNLHTFDQAIHGTDAFAVAAPHCLALHHRTFILEQAALLSNAEYSFWGVGMAWLDARLHTGEFFQTYGNWQKNGWLFCSELIVRCYQEVGITFGEDDARTVNPNDIARYAERLHGKGWHYQRFY